jgi:CubicO group peptidase (beta-lactamase class C family)
LSGGGGLVSTIDDYSKLLQYICNNLVDSKFSTTGNGMPLLTLTYSRTHSFLLTHSQTLVIPIKQSLFHEMVSNQLIEGKTLDTVAFDSSFSETAGSGISFGLGFSILESPTESRGGALSGQGEFGWGGIANTYFSIDIKKGIYMIFMTQLIPSSCFPIRPQLRYLVHKLYGKN